MRQPIAIRARVVPGQPDLVAIRWTVDAALGFPEDGFTLSRITNTGPTQLSAALRLPGTSHLPSGHWTIDQAVLLADLAGRTGAGVPMPDAARTLDLVPLLMFALGNPDPDLLQAGLEAVAKTCMEAHRTAPILMVYWQKLGKIPTIAAIAAMRSSATPDEITLYNAVIGFYRDEAVSRLLAIASDFGTAKLLGLGWDDKLSSPVPPGTDYEVEATYGGSPVNDRRSARQLSSPWPPPPSSLLNVSSGDGLVGYPPFEPFFGTRLRRWEPVLPPGGGPNDALFKALASRAAEGPRRWDTPLSRLRWTTKANPDDNQSAIMTDLAVHWQVERFAHGRASASSEVEPPRDPAATFKICHDGDQIPARPTTEFSDDANIVWGDPPMEGWYTYRVRGVDLFGITGPPSPVAAVRLLDTYAPTPPAVKLDLERVDIPASGTATLVCTIDWQAINEFQAPDTRVFRIYQRWAPVQQVGLRIQSAAPAPGDTGLLLADVVVADETGRPLDAAALAVFAGASLSATNADFRVRGPGTLPSSLSVERSANRIPDPGGASALIAGQPVDGPMREIARQHARAGALIVADWTDFAFAIATPDPGSAGRVTPAKGKLYIHILGATFDVVPNADGTCFSLRPPDKTEQPKAAEIFAALMSLPDAERTNFISGSPTLFLPHHEVALDLTPPLGASDLVAGTLRIEVSAADAAPYRHGKSGIGNEGPGAVQLVPVRVAKRPTPPAWRPRKLWADDAASFEPLSTISLHWPAIPLAASYQVERAFEDALRQPRSASDDILLAFAATQAADQAFQRVTERAFAPEWADTLPGTAPARVIYRVRGVSVAGELSAWMVIALVRVPDTRIPPPPNFLFTRPPADGLERTILCSWTQAGPINGVGFVIEARDDGAWDDEVGGWREVAELLPEDAIAGRGGRYTYELSGQRPGCRQQLRIRALRFALDPDDPLAQRTRKIRGPGSPRLLASAVGTLVAPGPVLLSIDSKGTAVLRWTSNDCYRRLEVQRRGPGRFGFERVEIAADATDYVDDALPAKGEWTYRIAGIGWGGRAVSDEVTAKWSSP